MDRALTSAACGISSQGYPKPGFRQKIVQKKTQHFENKSKWFERIRNRNNLHEMSLLSQFWHPNSLLTVSSDIQSPYSQSVLTSKTYAYTKPMLLKKISAVSAHDLPWSDHDAGLKKTIAKALCLTEMSTLCKRSKKTRTMENEVSEHVSKPNMCKPQNKALPRKKGWTYIDGHVRYIA